MADEKKMQQEPVTEAAVIPAPEKAVTAKEKKAKQDKKKKGFGSKIASFFRSYKSEMKKISWFSAKATAKNSWVVLVTMTIVGAIVCGADYGFSKLFNFLATLV